MQKSFSREQWADSAKGIAIILIVLGHVLRGLSSSGVIGDGTLFHLADNFLYSIHVPAFFFLSGYFLQASAQRGFKTYATSKIVWIAYPYVLWSLLQGSVNVVLSGYTNHPMGWSKLSGILWNPIGQFWFLHSLFLIHMAYFPLRKLPLYLVLAGTLTLWLTAISYAPWAVPTLLGANFVVLGMISRNAPNLFDQIKPNTPIFAGSFLFWVAALLWEGGSYQSVYMFPISIMGVLGLIGLTMHLPAHRAIGKTLALLGAASMAILLMHILAGSGMRIILSSVAHITWPPVHIVAGTLIGLIAPLIAFHILNRKPILLKLLGIRPLLKVTNPATKSLSLIEQYLSKSAENPQSVATQPTLAPATTAKQPLKPKKPSKAQAVIRQ